jgi:Zn-dependent protease with chaperone function
MDDERQQTSAMTIADAAPRNDAVYFDGCSNRKRKVTLRLAVGLEIVEDAARVDTWPFDAVRRADAPQGSLRLSCAAAFPLARLEIADPALQQAIVACCGSLDAGRERQTWRIAGWSLVAVASILMLVLYGIPLVADRMAPLVPYSVERRLGDAVDKQVRFLFSGGDCNNAEGEAALTTLIGKLRHAGGIEQPLDAQVLSSSLPNAFALPGGRVYLLNGLLQKANSVDEIAGVLAHELGHVRHRDGLRHLIQTGGTSFLAGLLFGDVTGGGAMIFVTRSLFNASYSRDVERDADAFAVATMRTLGRSPKPMAELLFRVTGTQANKGLDIISTHPLTEDRLATISRADRPNTGAPLLSEAEWQALKSICSGL